MVAGRGFSKDFATDTTQAIVLNEAANQKFLETIKETAFVDVMMIDSNRLD